MILARLELADLFLARIAQLAHPTCVRFGVNCRQESKFSVSLFPFSVL